MSTFLIYFTGLVLLATPFVVLPLLKSMAGNKAKQLHCVTNFFDKAPKLAADERLPQRHANMLALLGKRIDDSGFVLGFIRGMIEHRKNGGRKSVDQIEFNRTVDALPDDLRSEFREAVAYGLIAMSYSSFCFGGVLRAIWFEPVGMPQRSVDAPMFAYRGLAHC